MASSTQSPELSSYQLQQQQQQQQQRLQQSAQQQQLRQQQQTSPLQRSSLFACPQLATTYINESLADFIKRFTEQRTQQQQPRQTPVRLPSSSSPAFPQRYTATRPIYPVDPRPRSQQYQSFSVYPQASTSTGTRTSRYQQPAHSHSMSCLLTNQDNRRRSPSFNLEGEDAKAQEFLSTFALSSMSSDDAGFPGWDHHRAGDEDVYTSPLFTDTSPCLTDNGSFEPNSCDTSPLLANDLDASVGEAAHMPLFGDMTLFSPHQATEGSFDRTGANASTALPANFSLFPDVHAPPSPPRGQMAFNPAATEPAEDSATMLLRALQGIAKTHAEAQQAQFPVHSASPKLLTGDGGLDTNSTVETTRLAKPPLQHAATAPVFARHSFSFEGDSSVDCGRDDSSTATTAPPCTKRGVKRRLRVDDLLPLDAPIQSRNYLGPSSTSRKDWVPPSDVDAGPSAEELAAIQAESDPLKAKRLSNTLAARRSRHRKAAERAEFLARIRELEEEVSGWKRRCERAERERDELAGAVRLRADQDEEEEDEDEDEDEQQQ